MMNRRIVGVLILTMTMLAQAQPAANSIDWGFGRPGVRVVTNAPDHVVATGIASQVSSTLIASHSDVAGMHTTIEQQASWATAAGWGPHAGLYKALGWQPDWSDVLNKPVLPTAQDYINWNTAASLLSTQRVTRLWSSDGTQFAETGVVWQVGSATNYTVSLSADFLELIWNTRPMWDTTVFPFDDSTWQVVLGFGDDITARKIGVESLWRGNSAGGYPVTLVAETAAQGTAVVSQHISTVYTFVKAYASEADLTAVDTKLNNHVSTNAASVIAQAQPSTVMRYADFATTSTVGCASFSDTNPEQKSLIYYQSTLGQLLAKVRWDVSTALPSGPLSINAHAATGPFMPTSSNVFVYAVVTLYSASDTVIVSGVGDTVGIGKYAVSNISATVSLISPVVEGYVIAEIFCAESTPYGARVHAGGAYPFALTSLNAPLRYATKEWVSSLFALKDSGTQVNPTMAGTVNVLESMSVAGQPYYPTIAGTTNALPANANKTNGVVYLVYP